VRLPTVHDPLLLFSTQIQIPPGTYEIGELSDAINQGFVNAGFSINSDVKATEDSLYLYIHNLHIGENTSIQLFNT
jgi:hypothetical protein